MANLIRSHYLKFPFSVDSTGPQTSQRSNHIRELIEQVLFTSPKERVFRPEFGVGIRKLVFEPNNSALRNSTLNHLSASLADALYGEVDPMTIDIGVSNEQERLIIHITYTLAAINKREMHRFNIGSVEGNHG